MINDRNGKLLFGVVAILFFVNCFRVSISHRASEFQFVMFSNTFTDDGVLLEPDPQTVTSELLADG